MWRSSLMCLPDTSWGGGSHRLWKRHLCWMLWSRRYGPVDRPAQSITVIKVLSMYRWPTHSGLRKPDYWHQQHIAPSTYYHCQQQRHHPDKRSARAQRDDWLKKEIQRVYDENHKVYGVRKVWRQLLREGIRVARCTVARLMAVMGLAGVLRC